MNVLSAFDGMSCGQHALEDLLIYPDNYFACEIDKYAVQVTQRNFPKTVQLGDVTKVSALNLPKIDLFMGGSPCQGFSFAGKQLAFDDPRSALFFEFVRLWREVKQVNPDAYFLLENVKMKKEFQAVISEFMGVEPIEINSKLVSAQNRKRLYWTNIPGVTQPEDRGIYLRGILEPEVDEKYFLKPKGALSLKANYMQWDTSGKGYQSQQDRAFYDTGKPRSLDSSRAEDKCKVAFCVASRGRNP